MGRCAAIASTRRSERHPVPSGSDQSAVHLANHHRGGAWPSTWRVIRPVAEFGGVSRVAAVCRVFARMLHIDEHGAHVGRPGQAGDFVRHRAIAVVGEVAAWCGRRGRLGYRQPTPHE